MELVVRIAFMWKGTLKPFGACEYWESHSDIHGLKVAIAHQSNTLLLQFSPVICS